MKIRNLTFAAIMVAVSIVLMVLGTFVKTGTLAIYFILSLVIMIIKTETDTKTAFTAYFVSALLAFMLPVDPEISIMFAVITGIYPLIKAFAEKYSAVPQWVIKIVCFNVELIILYFTIRGVISGADFKSVPVFALAANIVFLVYDVFLSYAYSVYVKILRKYIIRK